MITEISKQMKFALTESAEMAANKTNLIQRRVKVTGSNLCQTLVMGWWQNPQESMEGLSQVAHSVGLNISPQGLDQRLTKQTANYLFEVLQTVVNVQFKSKKSTLPSMAPFTHVIVEDSSLVDLDDTLEDVWQGFGGSSSQSSVKLQTGFDLKHGQLEGPHLFDGRVHDNKAAKQNRPIEKGSLHLRDLGYWSLKAWETAKDEEYYALSRMKTSTHLWYEGTCYDCFEWCQQQQGNEFDVEILLGKEKKIPVRFIGKRASLQKSEEQRRKLKRAAQKRGQSVSDARLAVCDWTLIVTNVPEKLMTTKDAFTWLNVRWQVELLFKLWKSVGEIDKSRSRKPWRQLCEFYAKLIAMTLQHWLFLPSIWQFPDRSLTKAAKAIRLHVMRLATALSSRYKLSRIIKDICNTLSKGCRINRSKKQLRTYQKLERLEILNA